MKRKSTSSPRKRATDKLDRTFSKFIRQRDTIDNWQGRVGTCCSCQRIVPYEQLDAGHYINRRWKAHRWNEKNVHAQCRACNRFDEGNAVGYTRFMQTKYGDDYIDWLQGTKNDTTKFTLGELDLMNKEYKQKLKDLTDPDF